MGERSEGRGGEDTGRRVVLTIPSKGEYVGLTRLALAALGGQQGVDDETIADLKVAVTEACSLLVRQGEAAPAVPSADAAIRVELGLYADCWTVAVEAPRPPAQERVSLPDDELALTIIRALVDEVELPTEDAEQTVLLLVKRVA